jgi:hypothetical protein
LAQTKRHIESTEKIEYLTHCQEIVADNPYFATDSPQISSKN